MSRTQNVSSGLRPALNSRELGWRSCVRVLLIFSSSTLNSSTLFQCLVAKDEWKAYNKSPRDIVEEQGEYERY